MNRITAPIALALLFALLQFPLTPAYADEESRGLQQWRNDRFGLFIHWGPVSLKGTEIGWSRGGGRPVRKDGSQPIEGAIPQGNVPKDIYDNLYKEFNPTQFSAREWVRIAQEAGMKYLVFTTKHHDGFVNFDSALTDYKITSPDSPFGRDIVAELADACHQAGLGLGFYYSQPDWHHPDYQTENHDRYIEYLHGQVRELCTNYGKVDIFWFDGLGGPPDNWDAEKLLAMIRELQPEAIVNNRTGLPGDFNTPEQRVGAFQTDHPWETCMTIGTQWAWKPEDNIKSTERCIKTLLRVVGGDGNFLFNVGPMPDGRIAPRQVSRLQEMGQWLETHGESVYGTRGGPFKPAKWGVSTHRDNRIYLHVLRWPEERLDLPPIDAEIVAVSLLSGDEVKFKQNRRRIRITVAEADRKTIDTVVVLELDRQAAEIEPVASEQD